jgi:predicted nuclease with TOPRIM domain
MNQYDEIKMLLKRSRLLQEQVGPINMAKSIEDNIEQDEEQETEVDVDKVKKDKSKTYRISGGLLTLHGKDKKEKLEDTLVTMKEDLDDKKRELKASEMTADRLQEELTLRQTELEKINSLDAKIAQELKSLHDRMNGMRNEYFSLDSSSNNK